MRRRATGKAHATATVLALLALAAPACAPHFKQLDRLLDGADYAGASQWAKGSIEREEALAAGILEREARASADPLGAVRALAAAGQSGAASLERLGKGTAHPADELARIAASRRRPPSDEALESLLSSEFGDVRAYALSTWADDVPLDRVEKLALDLDPLVRRAALQALARFGGTSYAKTLCDAARLDPDVRVRSEAARAGSALGEEALDVLREIARAGEPGEVQAALLGLGDLGSPSALALLEERAFSAFDETAVLAAAELSRLSNKRGRERLLEALADERPNIRATAAVNLSRAGLDDLDERLFALLDDETPRIVLIAASALPDGVAGDRARSALRKLFEAGGAAGEEARDMLAVRGDEKALDATSRALAEADEEEALVILARAGSAAGLRDRIAALLGDRRARIRREAAIAYLR